LHTKITMPREIDTDAESKSKSKSQILFLYFVVVVTSFTWKGKKKSHQTWSYKIINHNQQKLWQFLKMTCTRSLNV
jgi:hypothetical protein